MTRRPALPLVDTHASASRQGLDVSRPRFLFAGWTALSGSVVAAATVSCGSPASHEVPCCGATRNGLSSDEESALCPRHASPRRGGRRENRTPCPRVARRASGTRLASWEGGQALSCLEAVLTRWCRLATRRLNRVDSPHAGKKEPVPERSTRTSAALPGRSTRGYAPWPLRGREI